MTQISKLYMTEFKALKISDITQLISKMRDDTIPEITSKRVLINLQSTNKGKNYFGYLPVDIPLISTILDRQKKNKSKQCVSRNSKNFLTLNRKSLERKPVIVERHRMSESPDVSKTDLSPQIRGYEEISGIYSSEIKRMEKHIGNLKHMLKLE